MIICITGQMAAGKNYIASKIVDSEITVDGSNNLPWVSIDLDKVVHSAMEDPDVVARIQEAFGEIALTLGVELVCKNGAVNRRSLGKVVFSDPALLKKQEDIVYPFVIKATKDFVEKHKDKNIIINATVLYKTPELLDMCSKVLFVKAPFIKRLIRARRRDKMPFRQIISRFKAQSTLEEQYRRTGKFMEIIEN